jgi:hypothetical protein
VEEGGTSRTEQSALMAGVGLPGNEVLLAVDMAGFIFMSPISYNGRRLSTNYVTSPCLQSTRHPRTSNQHDECHTKNGSADHDSESPISQTSTPHLGDLPIAFGSRINFRRHFVSGGFRGELP